MTTPRSSMSMPTWANKPRNAARTFSAIAGVVAAIDLQEVGEIARANLEDGPIGEWGAVDAKRELQDVLALGARIARQGFDEPSLGGVAEGQVCGIGAASQARIESLGDQGRGLAPLSAGFRQIDGGIGAQAHLLAFAVEGEAIGPDPPLGLGRGFGGRGADNEDQAGRLGVGMLADFGGLDGRVGQLGHGVELALGADLWAEMSEQV